MLQTLLCRFLSLWLVLGYHQCSWAAVPRNTKLKLGTSVVENASPFPLFSGDRVTFRIALTHTSTSQAKAVDALLQLEIPLYLKVVSYSKGNGIQWSSVDTAEKWTMKFKFDEIMISKSVNLSLVVDVDPHYIANAAASHSVAILVDLWYYGEDGPCSRPPDMYNAMHDFERLSLEIQTTTACEKRIELKSDQYSASSESSKGPAKYASFFQPGVWQTSDAMAREKNQFLQLDLSRLMRVTKIATRGQKTPSIAFVRTYHVYHSKNIIEWFSSRENNDIKVFQANTDGESVVFNPMPSPTIARYLRIVPKSWKKRQVMDVAVFGCQVHPNENLVDYCPIFDFENGVSGWTSTGTAFKNQPTYGDNYKIRTGTSADIQGNSWIATYEDRMRSYTPAGGKQGDAPVGTLTSPSFLIVVSKFRFLIGGTKNNSDVYAELVIDGKSVRKTSGSGDNMTEITWNVKQFSGKEAVLRLVDDTDKGHLNFDAFRVDCFLDADAYDIALPNRAVMLNPRTHSFYVCDSSHLRSEDSALCRVMSGLSDTWIDIPDIVGLLGVDKSTNQLYAVSKDRYVITSMNPAGGDWRYAKKSDWLKVKPKPSTVRMEAIPWITLRDGVNEETLKTLADSNGDQWRATSLGVGYKPAGQSWVKIAAWRCHVFENAEDPCFSEPCEHQANCTAISRGQYNCSCVPGYTGVNCETDIDECAEVFCENGGTCVQGINKYFCRCPYGVDGDHCENLLPACRTSPCLNGGNCVDETPPAFRCDCTSNYKGTLCEIEKEPCLINPCSNGAVCVPTDEGYRCVCQYGYTGTHCTTGIGINLKAVQTKTVTDVNSYLVIKAQIPSHGKSFLENWCKEYERLCKNYDREPTGFGRSYNHIEEYASCQENYFSVMDRANLLGANPNEKVAALAQQVGFTDATPNNSFAFNACDGSKCSSVLPESGCHEGLSCISRSVPNLEVYTVCIDPNSNFRTALKVWGVINGVRQLNLLVTTPSRYSKLTTWCDDYEALCDRYGLRAIGVRENTGCVEKYRAIFNPNNANGEVRDVVSAGSGFYFKDCAHCNSNSYSTSNAVHYFKYYYNNFGVACMQPNGIGFKVLDDKKLLNYNGKDYTVIKVQVPSNGSSYDKSWCEDYKKLCNSYKMVPLGCGSNCVAKYHSSFTTCPISGSEVEQMVRNAGFSSASSSNTFVYKSCEACSHLVNKGECRAGDLFCLDDANPYRVFYTACVKDDEKYLPEDLALRLRDFKLISYQSRPYKVLRLYDLPEDGYPMLSNWCEEYQALCKSVGGRPVGCGPSYTSDPNIANCGTAYGAVMDNDGLGCNNNGIIKDMVKDAGYNPSSYNTFMFHDCSSNSCSKRLTYGCYYWSCSSHPALSCLSTRMSRYSREAYAVCSMASSAFKVLETKDSTYGGHDVLVVKAQIPSDGSSFTRNWCEDYKALCYNYGYRPTGCGVDYADDSNYASCRYDYQSVMPADNVYGCPAVGTIALVANAAGFSNATVGNSFGFSDCNATCVSTLTNGGPFIDLSVTDGIVYTICETSDSNFKVMSTVQSVYKGGEYTFVQAQVPQDLISKHDTWCTDYQRMCESFGLKPVARSQLETKDEYVTCRKKYGAINTKLNEATTSSEIQTFGGPFLRYSRLDDNRNLFVFGQKCDDYCFKDLKDGYYEYALEDIYVSYLYRYDYTVSTVCASSDSNFRVISTKTIAHQGQDFLVIMAKLPEHRMSKYENWCRDYERLCRSFRKRPTGCGLSYQWSSKHRACVDKYQSAMAMNDPVGCNSSETVASIANLAGYKFAHMNNSFAFYQCSSECPQKLSSSCSDSLPCLNDRSDIVYTVCTDSSSAFEVERVVHTNEGPKT
ncbi:uncharacterized protein LOC114522366, partial [Dendronephthya gigantea]|uniref:uncharacterized protein LOC114522366 n=1 Tax=Dendronephthya gigantea TaxID=151771 RepID=UPI00106D0262